MDFAALIIKYRSSELKDLHHLIFKREVPDSKIKRNLITFLGFSPENFDHNLNYTTANFDAEELIAICTLLQIPPPENLYEDGKAIGKKLTVVGPRRQQIQMTMLNNINITGRNSTNS
ncbi:hypothetical protein ACFFRR_001468, partial [Megaselia abdita]